MHLSELNKEFIINAYKKYKKFAENNESYSEGYKYEILSDLNQELSKYEINADNIHEIMEIIEKKNPQSGTFVHWTSIQNLKKFTKENPELGAELLRSLLNDNVDLAERISEVKDILKQHSETLGTPLTGYLLASFDMNKYTIYKEEFFRGICDILDLAMPSNRNTGELYAFYLKVLDEIGTVIIEAKLEDELSLLEGQNFLYTIWGYEGLKTDILVLFLLMKGSMIKWCNDRLEAQKKGIYDGELKNIWLYIENNKPKLIKASEAFEFYFYYICKYCIEKNNKPATSAELKQYLDDIKYTENSNIFRHLGQQWSQSKKEESHLLNQDKYKIIKTILNREKEKGWEYSIESDYLSLVKENINYIQSKKSNYRKNQRKYWLYSPGSNANKWDEFYSNGIIALGWDELGDLKQYQSKEEIRAKLQELFNTDSSKKNDATANYEFKNVMSIGDIIIVKKGMQKLLGYGIVKSDYYYDNKRDDFKKCRKVEWKKKGEWEVDHSLVQKTLTDITDYSSEHPKYEKYYERLLGIMDQSKETHYFWITANPSKWSPTDRVYGEQGTFYTAINKKGNKRNVYKDFYKAKPEDKIIFYESSPTQEIVAMGKVTQGIHKELENGYDEEVPGISIKCENEVGGITWEMINDEPILQEAQPVINKAQGSLFEITKQEYETILDLKPIPVYNDFSERLGIDNLYNNKHIEIEDLYFKNKKPILKQIHRALKTGKHIILNGPPGTGKSKLAKKICKHYCGNCYKMTTATSDWSTFDTIGGLMPKNDGQELEFNKGIFLKCFQNENGQPDNNWLLLDEINRADIDKAFGALFSALTGDNVTLAQQIDDENIQIIGKPDNEKVSNNRFFIHPDWRIIATMNTFDKTSLYEMSYAFMRRFAFINIGVPDEVDSETINNLINIWDDFNIDAFDEDLKEKIASLWSLINQYRKIGPAIVEDILRYKNSGGNFCDAITMYVIPQFEGLEEKKLKQFYKQVKQLLDEDTEGLKKVMSDFFEIDEEGFENAQNQ